MIRRERMKWMKWRIKMRMKIWMKRRLKMRMKRSMKRRMKMRIKRRMKKGCSEISRESWQLST